VILLLAEILLKIVHEAEDILELS